MKVIPFDRVQSDSAALEPLVEALDRGRLICVPHHSGYRLLADVTNPDAVTELLQAKRRTRHAPSLVFVDSAERVTSLSDEFSEAGRQLAEAFWPGPLTVLVRPSAELPRRVVKALTKANKHLGVRVPSSPLIRELVSRLGRPLMASSANRERRPGESSAAQVRRFFGQSVEMLVDAGDLKTAPRSTVVCVDNDKLKFIRSGAISDDEIRGVLAA